MKILFSTIVRDRARQLDIWNKQINELAFELKDHECYLSVVENDSKDLTKVKLMSSTYKAFKSYFICVGYLGTSSYGSVVDEQRVKNLSLARNQTINQFPFLSEMDIVVSVEPDIVYDPKDMVGLVEKHCNEGWDILSGISRIDDSQIVYDTWPLRFDDKTTFGSNQMIYGCVDCWATFNCFCVYRAKAIIEGCRFGWYNRRLDRFDCDTAVICEEFREKGYNKIGLDGKFSVQHYREVG